MDFKENEINDDWIAPFYDINDGEKTASCRICGAPVESADMLTHLDTAHPTSHTDEHPDSSSDPLDNTDNDSDYETNTERERPKRKRRSRVWGIFQYMDRDRAMCRICGKVLAHGATTSNLMKHWRLTHQLRELTDVEKPYNLESWEMQAALRNARDRKRSWKRGRKSAMWQHFVIVSRSSARCKHCSQVLSFSTSNSNLIRHLQRRHPAVNYDRAPASREPDEKDNAPPDSPLTDTSTIKHEETSEQRAPSPLHVYTDDVLTDTRHVSHTHTLLKSGVGGGAETEAEGECEVFARYLASLLRSLPRLRRLRAQTQLINIAMEAQIEHESSRIPDN